MDEMSPEEFREAGERTVDWVASYRERLGDLPVRSQVRPGDILARVSETPPDEGQAFEAILDDLEDVIVPGLTHWNHPRFFAYFPSSSSPPAVLAELVAAAVNQNAMLWQTAPAATELEERMVDWVRRLVGLPDGFGGVVQDTASSGSFTALVAAREALGLDVRRHGLAGRPEMPALTMYVSGQTHSSLEKAAIAAGLGQKGVRRVPTDEAHRMDPEALAERIDQDRREGLAPVMVCATIGTTSTASVDPVDAIADVCEERDVWLHVDAAYAGPAAMLPEQRPAFEGWERADSIVLNPHKWLSTPIDCSLLLFPDPEPFRASLALTPEYLRTDEEQITNLMDYGLPLGRRFRALKLWFLIRWHGADGIRDRLRRHIEWAGAFAARVEADRRFELAAPASFSTVCFRALPPSHVEAGGEDDARETGAAGARGTAGPAGVGADTDGATAADTGGRESDRPLDREEGVDTLAANEWNAELQEHVNRQGAAYLTHAELAGSRVLRLSVGSFTTREDDVRRAWDAVTAAYEALAAEEASPSGSAGPA